MIKNANSQTCVQQQTFIFMLRDSSGNILASSLVVTVFFFFLNCYILLYNRDNNMGCWGKCHVCLAARGVGLIKGKQNKRPLSIGALVERMRI